MDVINCTIKWNEKLLSLIWPGHSKVKNIFCTKFSNILVIFIGFADKRLCIGGKFSPTNYLSFTVKNLCIVFLREARLSPYAVSTHTNSNAQMKRPKSAILPQRGRSKRSTDPPNWESIPRTVIGWADRTDWAVPEQRPKQRTRPVSAPATRNRWVGQIVQFCNLRRCKAPKCVTLFLLLHLCTFFHLLLVHLFMHLFIPSFFNISISPSANLSIDPFIGGE